MALLQPQDSLGFDAERAAAEIVALGEEFLPNVERMAGRYVELVGEFPGETDAPDDAVGHTGHGALAHAEVREGISIQVDAFHDALQQGSGVRPGHVDAG